MKKPAAKHTKSINLNMSNFFSKHIDIMGLILIVLFFIIYFLADKINNLESKMMQMEVNVSEVSQPENSKMIPQE
jgi:predicted Holliday junction resolvase-like endonuclease